MNNCKTKRFSLCISASPTVPTTLPVQRREILDHGLCQPLDQVHVSHLPQFRKLQAVGIQKYVQRSVPQILPKKLRPKTCIKQVPTNTKHTSIFAHGSIVRVLAPASWKRPKPNSPSLCPSDQKTSDDPPLPPDVAWHLPRAPPAWPAWPWPRPPPTAPQSSSCRGWPPSALGLRPRPLPDPGRTGAKKQMAKG